MPAAGLENFPPATCADLRRRLRVWHRHHARDLPWRSVRDPYRVWLSEIMLQQTTVAAVIPYYERFLARFPTVAALAAADESQVLQLWEGLGYYSRGRNLHRSARVVANELGGQFPEELAGLQALPGVGRYTAGAIRSFGFNLPAPIVEANTQRLYSRLLGLQSDPRTRESQTLLWSFAELLQPRSGAGDFNQALMDLGATVCTPREPDCPDCPLRSCCQAFLHGQQNTIPLKAARAAPTEVVEASLAIHNAGRWFLRQRQAGERWQGMWDFPRVSIPAAAHADPWNAKLKKSVARAFVQAGWPVDVQQIALRTELRHTVTRFSIRLLCLTCPVEAMSGFKTSEVPLRWAALDDFAELPLPVTTRRFSKLLATDEIG